MHKEVLHWKKFLTSCLVIDLAIVAWKTNVSEAEGLFTKNSAKENSLPHEIHRLRVDGYINAVAWNADGSRLAALSNFGGTITVWDASSWKKITEFQHYGGAYSFNSFSYLPDGSLLATSPIGKSPDPRYETLSIFALIQWNPETGQAIRYIPNVEHLTRENGGSADMFVVAPNRNWIAAINRSTYVSLYSATNGDFIRNFSVPALPTHADRPRSTTFSPNQKELAVGTDGGKLYYFDPTNGALLRQFDTFKNDDYSCGALAYKSDGELIAIAKNKNFDVLNPTTISTEIMRVSDGAVMAFLPGATTDVNVKIEAVPVRTLAWKPNDDVLAIGDDKALHIWRINATETTQLLDAPLSGLYSVKYSPNGILAAASANEILIVK